MENIEPEKRARIPWSMRYAASLSRAAAGRFETVRLEVDAVPVTAIEPRNRELPSALKMLPVVEVAEMPSKGRSIR